MQHLMYYASAHSKYLDRSCQEKRSSHNYKPFMIWCISEKSTNHFSHSQDETMDILPYPSVEKFLNGYQSKGFVLVSFEQCRHRAVGSFCV